MARFKDINYEELGKYMRALIKDPARMAQIKAGEVDIKQELAQFMTPRDREWSEITIYPHFDEETVVNISFPFTGDVEASIAAIAPEGPPPGDIYEWPKHYSEDPNTPGMAGETVKDKRKRLYHCRIGDYVMARCR